MKGDKKRSGGALLQEKIQARSSSLTSSEMSDEGSSELEVAKMPPTIQTLTECLHRIHALEKDSDDNYSSHNQNNLQNSLLEALGLVQLLKKNQLEEMPFSVRKRAVDSVERNQENFIGQQTELVFLFGRCFNLSMNIKILNQCNYADPTIASRLMIDFHVIDSSLQTKLMHYQCDSLDLMSLNKR